MCARHNKSVIKAWIAVNLAEHEQGEVAIHPIRCVAASDSMFLCSAVCKRGGCIAICVQDVAKRDVRFSSLRTHTHPRPVLLPMRVPDLTISAATLASLFAVCSVAGLSSKENSRFRTASTSQSSHGMSFDRTRANLSGLASAACMPQHSWAIKCATTRPEHCLSSTGPGLHILYIFL